jgi:hypothetical protein
MTKHLDPTTLSQFIGTENWYRHSLARSVTYTDGVKYVADEAGAYWLVDIIAIAQEHTPALKDQSFQTWKLTVKEDASAVVVCTDGGQDVDDDGKAIYRTLYRQKISFTDFPLREIEFYCCRDGLLGDGIAWVILLPSEY